MYVCVGCGVCIFVYIVFKRLIFAAIEQLIGRCQMFERELELSDVSKEVFKVLNVGLIGVMVHWSNAFYCFYSLTSHSQRPKEMI